MAFNGKFKNTQQKSYRRAAVKTWHEFLSTSTIHGLKHITDSQSNTCTKLFWFIVSIGCFGCAIALMMTFLNRYRSNPTRINVDTNYQPIQDVNFPSIIFCSTNMMTPSQIYNFIQTLDEAENISDTNFRDNIRTLAGFTSKMTPLDNSSEYEYLHDVLTENRYNVATAMMRLTYPCHKLLKRCRWQGRIVNCQRYFKTIGTFMGFCCGFNSLHFLSSTGSTTIEDINNKKVHSLRTDQFGTNGGLSVILQPQFEYGAISSSTARGVRLLIQASALFPSEKSFQRIIPMARETLVEVRPEQTRCSDRVRSLPRRDRGCLFFNEKELKFFPSYTEHNCAIDCRMQRTIRLCQCLPYFYDNTGNVRECTILDLPCIIENYDALSPRTKRNANQTLCDCPQHCTDERYYIGTSSTNIDLNTTAIDPFYSRLTDQHMIVHIYFPSQTYRIFIRTLLTNIIALIANLGGVYSLLIGMSIISLLEIIYFATIRFYFNYKISTDQVAYHNDSNVLLKSRYHQQFHKNSTPIIYIPRLNTAATPPSKQKQIINHI